MEQSVVAHLDKPFRQHVSEKPPDEAVHRQPGPFLRSGFTFCIAKCHLPVCHLLDAVVAQGNAEDVWSKILEGAHPAPDRPAVHHPRFGPGAGINLAGPRRLTQPDAELCSKELTERFDM